MLLLLHSGYSSITFSDDNLVAIRSSTPETELPKYGTDKNKHRDVWCQADVLSRLQRLQYFKKVRVKLFHKGIGNQMKRTDTSVVLVQIGWFNILPLPADSFLLFKVLHAFILLTRSIFYYAVFCALLLSPGMILLQSNLSDRSLISAQASWISATCATSLLLAFSHPPCEIWHLLHGTEDVYLRTK